MWAQVVTVQEGDAFVSLYPSDVLKISCGVDCPTASIIGKQWFSWTPDTDDHYRWIIAPARTFYTSLEASPLFVFLLFPDWFSLPVI